MNRGVIAVAMLMTVGFIKPARGQASATTLVVELANVVEYQMDVTDLSKWGTNPNVTQGIIAMGMGVGCVGVPVVAYGDIVSVNGEPVRGAYVGRAVSVCLSPNPTPGAFAISDISANSLRDETYYILQSDGVTPIGTIMVNGLNGSVSPTPPGPPAGPQNYTIVGGTGAFLGARGQKRKRKFAFKQHDSRAYRVHHRGPRQAPAERRWAYWGGAVCRSDVAAECLNHSQRSRCHALQRLLTRQRIQAGRGGRDFVSVRYRPGADSCQPGSRPTVPIEFTGSSQFAHCADGQRKVRGGAGGSWVPRRYR